MILDRQNMGSFFKSLNFVEFLAEGDGNKQAPCPQSCFKKWI